MLAGLRTSELVHDSCPMDAIIVATAVEERCDAIIGNDSMMAARTTDIPYLYLNDYV